MPHRHLFLIVLFIAGCLRVPAQITSYPYIESFELSGGGWTGGGAGSSWAWGIPADPVINAAGHGTRCWATGLAAPYNSNELSTLLSPVFDMTSLVGPMVSFMLFRETEPGWDGAGFQYSINGGATWSDFPLAPANCYRTNWYSNPSITYNDFPANNPGWSGNITNIIGGGCSNGGGMGVWQTATHCLNNLPADLAGQSNVRFRFTFGAGSICQDDGAAVDLFTVLESPIAADFVAFCLGGREVQFEATSTLPGCVATFPGWSFTWNFGDPASGLANTDAGYSPAHIFTADGTYTITMTATNPCDQSIITVNTVYVDMTTCLLPEEEIHFEGHALEGNALLRWHTTAGNNGDRYMLERSTDGLKWEYVCALPVSGEQGEMKDVTYQDKDVSLSGDVIWYKLGYTDPEGNRHHLAITEVNPAQEENLLLDLWPNPAGNGEITTARLSGVAAEPVSLTLHDATGRLLWESPAEQSKNGTLSFSLPQTLPPGIYIVMGNDGDRKAHARLMVR